MKKIIFLGFISLILSSCAGGDRIASESSADPSTGKGGSMARFAIQGDVLYAVTSNNLKVFNIEEAANPKYSDMRDVQIGFDIETIYPMDTLLFIGSRNGMYIYSITEPRFPTLLGQALHLRSCDPVVAQGQYAFVTLNTNSSRCGAMPNNVLEIYDVSRPTHPVLKKTVSMKGPTGLGVDGSKLFVCDRGLKVFDITDPLNIKQIDDLANIDEVDIRDTYDVIPLDGLLILTAKEGLYQFDYTGAHLKYVSKIEIK